jgi:hypothetical protein
MASTGDVASKRKGPSRGVLAAFGLMVGSIIFTHTSWAEHHKDALRVGHWPGINKVLGCAVPPEPMHTGIGQALKDTEEWVDSCHKVQELARNSYHFVETHHLKFVVHDLR